MTAESAAALLRRAAEHVEERASAATAEPWLRVQREWSHPNVAWSVEAPNLVSDSRSGVAHATAEDSAWISLVGPQVAGPLASWLRATADAAESEAVAWHPAWGDAQQLQAEHRHGSAIALALALLGETPGKEADHV